MTANLPYWSGLFPDAQGQLPYWSGLFPDAPLTVSSTLIAGVGPEGVAQFALVLEEEIKVTYQWETGISKSYDGKERRSQNQSLPNITLSGIATLIDEDFIAVRDTLQQYASLGQPFLLGLPYEEITIDATSLDETISLTSTSTSDWAQLVGQRVIVMGPLDQPTPLAVLQTFTSDSITLDVIPENADYGGRVMPAVAVHLMDKQGFQRFLPVKTSSSSETEKWHIEAAIVNPGPFASGSRSAQIALEAPLTNSGVLDDVILVARTPGLASNDITVQFSDDALTDAGELIEGPTSVHVKYMGDTTTLDQLDLLIQASSLILMTGTWDPTDILASSDDEFGPAFLDGGLDAAIGTIGVGATLTEFNGKFIWDRPVQVELDATESLQAMNDVVSVGGVPMNFGMTTQPDWGRQISIKRKFGLEWQWFKKFLYAVSGSWKSFWLSTWREDLRILDVGSVGFDPDQVTIVIDKSFRNLFLDYPRLHMMVVYQNSTAFYLDIVSAVDNLDDTISAVVEKSSGGTFPNATDPIDFASWMELVRLESDTVDVTFQNMKFHSSLIARVVQR